MNENVKNERKIMYNFIVRHVEIFIHLINFHKILKLFH